MRIFLINPSQDDVIKSEVPSFVQKDSGLYLPLGLMYIEAYLRRNSAYEVRILDAQAERLNQADVLKQVNEFSPDVVGITAYTHNLLGIIRLSKEIKRSSGDSVHITLGGPHIRAFPSETIKIPYIDSVIFGEGEVAFCELVDCLTKKKTPHSVKGLIFKYDGQIVSTGNRKEQLNLDCLPFPERRSINYKAYYNLFSEERIVTTMLASRGCPYRCSFCDSPHGKHRVRSSKNIIEEIKDCLKLGIREIYFIDDVFHIDKERTQELCDEILRHRLSFKWGCRGRVNGLTPTLIKKMREAGCSRIHLGVETATDEGLRMLNKGITIAQIKEAFRLIKEEGISTVAYFMLGCPHEKTERDVLNTIEFALRLDPDFVLFNILTPYPSAQLYKEGLRKGIFKNDFWREFAVNPEAKFVPKFWEEYLSADELYRLLRLAYRRFYLRPKFILRHLIKIRAWDYLIKDIRIGCQILR